MPIRYNQPLPIRYIFRDGPGGRGGGYGGRDQGYGNRGGDRGDRGYGRDGPGKKNIKIFPIYDKNYFCPNSFVSLPLFLQIAEMTLTDTLTTAAVSALPLTPQVNFRIVFS